jgi:hypothetical protein
MLAREGVDVLTDDDPQMFEAHPVDALVDRRDELDMGYRHPVEHHERLGEDDLRDRPAVPNVLEIGGRVTFQQGPLMDVKVPIGDANGEMAEGVRCDVDSPRDEPVALRRRERPVVPDDVGDRISVATWHSPPPSYERTAGHTVPGGLTQLINSPARRS